jgi:hypothetical protein
MKGLRAALVGALAAGLLSACGGDNNTTFVLSSASASGSASATTSGSTGSSASPASSSLPTTAATPIAGPWRIIIDSPDGSSAISSPVQVSGTASVANGAVVAVVKDAGGNELGRGTATASASKPDYGHYDVTVTFSGATSGAKGEIRVFDAATEKSFYFIQIRFA